MNGTYQKALCAAVERLTQVREAMEAACACAQEAFDALPEADAEGAAGERLLNEIANLEDSLEALDDSMDFFRGETK